MRAEYATAAVPSAAPRWFRLIERWKRWVRKLEIDDQGPPFFWARSAAAITAWKAVAGRARTPGAVCISVGGGPKRHAAGFLNINLGPYPNVDIVGDAYALPYPDQSIDAAYCIAVLEHLEFPDRAVAEIARVLKPGGEVLFDTPLLQQYHGYPDHFQNFTLPGQVRLVERQGLVIVSSGASVGPSYALWHMAVSWITLYSKPWLRPLLSPLLIRWIRSRDKTLNEHALAHVMASTTFVHAKKN